MRKINETELRAKINTALEDIDETVLLMDGFDEALVGIAQRINTPTLAVYDFDKMVELLVARDGMDYVEAVEYIEFNCAGAWVGEQTPIIYQSLILK